MFLSCIIYIKENRDFETCNIPGAFIKVDMDKNVRVQLTGPCIRILAQVNKNINKKHIYYEKGIPVVFMRLKKALYGNIQEDLLF